MRSHHIMVNVDSSRGHTADTKMFMSEISGSLPHVDATYRICHDSFDLFKPSCNVAGSTKIAIQPMLYCFSQPVDIANAAAEPRRHRFKKRQRHALEPRRH